MKYEHLEELQGLINRYEWPKAVAVTGALGSGKTEWVLNLAAGFNAVGNDVTIADADIINPYFCIRQVTDALESEGFQVITAPGEAKWSDMPVVTSEVDRVLSEEGKRILIDIGGDAEGALALKQYERRLRQANVLLILVVNAFRPQTSNVTNIKVMRARMESYGTLPVGAVISNSHLMTETTPENVYEGYLHVKKAAEAMQLPLLYASTRPAFHDATVEYFKKKGVTDVPLWCMERHMLLPWEPGAIWGTGTPAKNRLNAMIRNDQLNRAEQEAREKL